MNVPAKRQRLAEWIQKQDPYISCLQETHLKTRDAYRLKVKGWKKKFHTNRDQKKAVVAILLSDKINFEIKTMTRDSSLSYAVSSAKQENFPKLTESLAMKLCPGTMVG